MSKMSVNWRAMWEAILDCEKHPIYRIALVIGIAIAGVLAVTISILAFAVALVAAVFVPFVFFCVCRIYFAKRGWVYEIVNLEETWEIHDATGATVTLKKVMDVEFLRDQVTSIHDPAWGAGELFAEYSCSPGRYVGISRSGERQLAVVMLDPPRRRGDSQHFDITRVIKGGFTGPDEWIELDSETCTGPLKVSVVFPRDRLPQNCQWTRRRGNSEKNLGAISQRWREDGRQECYVRVARPSPDEIYRVTWTW